MKKHKPSKEEYIKYLSEGICEVGFQKKNGDVKIVTCSLLPILIPKNVIEKFVNRTNRRETENIVSAYDIVNNRWCSFNINLIFSFRKLKVNKFNIIQ